MNELTQMFSGSNLAHQLKIGMRLDREETRRLIRSLEQLDSADPGLVIMYSQLRAMLVKKDWLRIHISATDIQALKLTGVSIGVLESKLEKRSTRLSPMQKWQRKNGLGRRV